MSASSSVRLKDVAQRAGVSIMTASRVLADHAGVSPASREAVQRAARELGYQPNPMIRRVMSELRRGRSHAVTATITFLNTGSTESDWRTLPYLRPAWEGARERALASGFAFDELWISAPAWSARRTEGVLAARGIQGLLVVPGTDPAQLTFPLDDFALAGLGGLTFDLPLHQVLPDHAHNYAQCYRQLWALGYRRIGLFVTDYDLRLGQHEQLGGYLSARWCTPAAHPVAVGGADAANWQVAEPTFKHWVRHERPDAVIANHSAAAGWLADLGLRPPDDIGLVHAGLAADVAGWSGIDPDLRTQGAHAVDLITSQLLRNEFGPPPRPKRLTLRGTWVAGRTTRPH